MTDDRTDSDNAEDDPRNDIEPVRDIPDRLETHVVHEELEDIKERVEIIATVARRSEFWSGPLPSDEWMEGYKKVDASIVPAIIDDFTRQSIASVEAVSHQGALEQHKLDIEKTEQVSRIHGEESDIRYRWVSGGVLWVIAAVVAIGFLMAAWKFFDAPSFSGALGLLIVSAVLAIVAVIIGGKGRLTQIEGTTQADSLNSVAKAVKALRGGPSPEDGDN